MCFGTVIWLIVFAKLVLSLYILTFVVFHASLGHSQGLASLGITLAPRDVILLKVSPLESSL